MSPEEQAKLTAAQSKVSKDIHGDRTNGAMGNVNSASNQRLEADVQHNVNQEQRTENGIQSGNLSNKEVGKIENGQKRVDNAEASAASNNHVTGTEQGRIQNKNSNQSNNIYNKRHNGNERGGSVK